MTLLLLPPNNVTLHLLIRFASLFAGAQERKGIVSLCMGTLKDGERKDIEFELSMEEMAKLKGRIENIKKQMLSV